MADENVRVYRFGDDDIEAPTEMSVDQVREVWSSCHPALVNAEARTEEDGSVTFVVQGGSKG